MTPLYENANNSSGKRTSSAGHKAILVVSAFPFLVAVAYLARHGVNVPFWDEWIEPADNAIKTRLGTLAVADLFRQYNDSRPLFTNLLTVISTVFFSWNLRFEMYVDLIVASATLGVLYVMCRRHLEERALIALPVLSLLTFSLTQRTNFVWAIQSQYFFLIVFFVLALRSLDNDSKKWRHVLGASAFSACMTFSYANGPLGWFLLPPVMWWIGYRRAAYYGYWLAVATLVLGAYFHDYRFGVMNREPVTDPRFHGTFVLSFLGNALVAHSGPLETHHVVRITLLGGLGVITFVANVAYLYHRERSLSAVAVWIGLASLTAASGAMISVTRGATRGLPGAMAGRYTTLSILFWIALVAVSATAVRACLQGARSAWVTRSVLGANVALVLLEVILVVAADVRLFSARTWVTEQHRICLEKVPETRDISCLRGLHPVFDPGRSRVQARELALEKIDRLDELRLGVFARR